MESTAFSENLRRLRAARRLSQAALAERAGLSLAGYKQVEAGRAEPRDETVRALTKALGVSLEALFRPVAPLAHVRFRSEEPLRTRREIEAHVSNWLADHAQLEAVLEERQPWSLSDLASRTGRRVPARVAAAAREALGLGPHEQIRDPCGLLEDNGVKVGTLVFATRRFFGLSVGSGGAVPPWS